MHSRTCPQSAAYPVALDDAIVHLEEKETRKQVTVWCYESSIDFMCLLNASWVVLESLDHTLGIANTFTFPNSQMRQGSYYPSFTDGETEELSNLPKDTLLESGKVRIQTQLIEMRFS